MCAIAGFADLKTTDEIRNGMLRTMQRRGPDGSGSYTAENCTLLHTRLAIIDPEGGAQPMELELRGECFHLVYNGELYNTEEIRYLLLKEGHSFLGHSDTEVVLHAYAQWGAQCVERLNGIFAFAVWETRKKRLFLARDRIGVKPLFYKLHQGGIIFASEMKTILAYPGVKARLDREGAWEILLMGPGRTPGCGVFRDILEVKPGFCGYYEAGNLKLCQYWRLSDREHRESFEETAECVRYLVTDAIRRQMVSDVPIGTFLSGGLDSSIITAVCADQYGEKLKTFSLDYENNDRYFRSSKFQPNSDPYFIRLMQEKLNTDHRWTVLTPENLVDALEDATIARDLPGMADVDFSLLAFCREIREDVKVALSGECADEIFGGYPWYRDPEVRMSDGFPWAQNTKLRIMLLDSGIQSLPEAEAYIHSRYRQTVEDAHVLEGTSAEEKRMKQMVNLNFSWFMQTLLDRKDRMSMYSGLEVRVPFCDYRIAEYLYAVPWEFKDFRGKEKGLLRTAMEGLLPEAILWRKKSPYPKTFDPRYETIVTSRLRKLLEEKDAPLFALVDRRRVAEILNREEVWPWYGQLMKRPQTIAYLLQVDFWLRHYEIELLF